MDPPHVCRPLRPCLLHHPHHHLHQHHHHHHPLFLNPHLPHHHHHCHHHHHHLRPNLTSYPQNPQQATPIPFPTYSNPETSELKGTVLQEQNHEDVALEEEEDDDPIFVLTDEWKEFFAKSEAKRKLARKQAKQGKR